MKKYYKIGLIIAFVLTVMAGGLFYVNKVLLPVQVKELVTKAAQDALGRKVSFDALQYNLIQGFTLDNLSIFSKENPEEVFLHLDHASVQVLFLALFQKKVILPSVRIDNLSVRITRINETTWNFSDLLTANASPASAGHAPQKTAGAKQAPMDVIISGLQVNNARVKLTDLARGEAFTEMIEPIDISGSLSLASSYHFVASFNIPATKGHLAIDARGSLQNLTTKAKVSVSAIDVSRYFRFIPENISLPLASAIINNIDAEVLWQNNILTLSGNVALANIDAKTPDGLHAVTSLGINRMFFNTSKDGFSFQGAMDLQGLALTLPDNKTLSADIHTKETRFAMTGSDWEASTDADIRNLIAVLSEAQRVHGHIDLSRSTAKQHNGEIAATADVALTDTAVTLGKDQTISGNIALTKATATINGPDISVSADITIDALKAALSGIKLNTSLTIPGGVLSISKSNTMVTAAPVFKSLALDLPQGLSFTGTPSASLHAVIPSLAKEEPAYNGTITVTDGQLKGLPVINTVDAVAADLVFSTNNLTIKSISLNALGTPVRASGTIKNFSDPDLNIKAAAPGLDLSLLERVIPQIVKDNGLAVQGKADVSVDVNGKAAALDKADIKATATITGTAIASTKLNQRLDSINGTLSYISPVLSWKELSVIYLGKTYLFNGYLENPAEPLVATSIKSDNLLVDAQVKKTADELRIISLDASIYDSSFSTSGTVFLPAGKPLTLDVKTDGRLSLRDVPKFLPPEQVKAFNQLKLSGILKVNAHVKGNPAQWQQLASTIALDTPALYAMGYHVENLQITAEQKDGKLDPFEIKANVYDGDLSIIGNVDITSTSFPMESTFKLENTKLELLKKDTPLKDQQLSGLVGLSGDMKGQPADLKSLKGKIVTSIKNGYLWDLKILSNVLGILASSFQGGDVVISEASATLNVNDGKVETNDLLLKGNTVSVLGEGWISMIDQTIDMNATPRLEATTSTGTTVNPLEVINPTAGIMNIHIGGTLQQPKITHDVTAPTIIKKTLQNTVGGLLKLFE